MHTQAFGEVGTWLRGISGQPAPLNSLSRPWEARSKKAIWLLTPCTVAHVAPGSQQTHLLGLRDLIPFAQTAHPQPGENKQRKLPEQEANGFQILMLVLYF